MSLIGKMRDKWRRNKQLHTVGVAGTEPGPPVIETQWGDVTESARRQAARNMRENAELRTRVEQLLADQLFQGDLAKGRAEAQVRYPECYEAVE